MMKVVGAIMIFAAGGAACRALLLQRRREIRTMEALARDFQRIGGEIHCRLTPLPALMSFAASGASAETRDFWSEVAGESGKRGAPPLGEIFSGAEDKLCASREVLDIMQEFGRSFEGLDEQGVLRRVDSVVSAISAAAEERRAAARDGRRITVCACFSMSALLAILLA